MGKNSEAEDHQGLNDPESVNHQRAIRFSNSKFHDPNPNQRANTL